jgi:hypothetical protein
VSVDGFEDTIFRVTENVLKSIVLENGTTKVFIEVELPAIVASLPVNATEAEQVFGVVVDVVDVVDVVLVDVVVVDVVCVVPVVVDDVVDVVLVDVVVG